MAACLDDLLSLEEYYARKMHDSFTTDVWTAENFLYDLPCKWRFSKLGCHENRVAGYWLVSCKRRDHLQAHRVVTAPAYQAMGVGKRLFNAVLSECVNGGIDRILVETGTRNEHAIQFYEALKFDRLGSPELRRYLAGKQRSAYVRDGYLEERDGSRYFVYCFSVNPGT